VGGARPVSPFGAVPVVGWPPERETRSWSSRPCLVPLLLERDLHRRHATDTRPQVDVKTGGERRPGRGGQGIEVLEQVQRDLSCRLQRLLQEGLTQLRLQRTEETREAVDLLRWQLAAVRTQLPGQLLRPGHGALRLERADGVHRHRAGLQPGGQHGPLEQQPRQVEENRGLPGAAQMQVDRLGLHLQLDRGGARRALRQGDVTPCSGRIVRVQRQQPRRLRDIHPDGAGELHRHCSSGKATWW
jgi:hypothetical protein